MCLQGPLLPEPVQGVLRDIRVWFVLRLLQDISKRFGNAHRHGSRTGLKILISLSEMKK